jgi:fatty acid desaturase
MQGFCVDWWMSKHNTHHAAPNELQGGSQLVALDPDIDTLPILSWSPEQLQTTGPTLRWLLRYQHYYFAPVLLFARLAWAQQSFAHAYTMMARLPLL